jgi:GNAT-family acetyltransferase (TIGR03103 family)
MANRAARALVADARRRGGEVSFAAGYEVREAELPHELDPSSRLIIEEARRRGITVEILAPRAEYFRLRLGGRTITCRESLSELTSAVALSRCDDKRVCSAMLRGAGLVTPAQQQAGTKESNEGFLRAHGAVVVKPARGEQGKGVCVDIRSKEALARAIEHARTVSDVVLLEELVRGEDLRIIVMGEQVVAAAVRRPPRVSGDGVSTLRSLIAAESARRAAATAGESKIPIDAETERCVREAGHGLDDVLARDVTLTVRRAANLHTGGTIEDVTAELHPTLAEVARKAARVLEIPVLGLDLMVHSPCEPTYWIIEANERPGLANHEPQPTAERFVDTLFPESRALRAPAA